MKTIRPITVIGIILCMFLLQDVNTASADTVRADYQSIERQIEEDLKKYHIPAMAVAVVDKDEVLYEHVFGSCDSADRPFIIGSMSKSFTALAIMQLREQGKIDLDSPMDSYIDTSEWFAAGTDHGRITVRDLLNQTSGITTFQSFGKLESTDSYGTHVYANANYGLLGLIVESVSGMSYEQYLEQNIFGPLGMSHSAATLEKSMENGLIEGYRNYFGIPAAGKSDYPDTQIHSGMWTNIPAGYLSASLSDMEKYLQMYLGKGDIISGESINSMFYDNVPAGEGTYYGMGWNYETGMFSRPVMTHAGLVENYTSNMFIIPDENIAVVVLVNMNDYLVGNNLLGNIVNPLLGEERVQQPDMYIILHAAIDAVCLVIVLIGIYSFASLKKWKTKTAGRRAIIPDILMHIVLPVVLLSVPPVLNTPYSVMWLFVKDVTAVIVIGAAVLIISGVYKAVYMLGRKKTF